MLERLDRYEMATIVQAQGPPLRRFGVPPGGPMDRQSWQPFAHESEVWELFGLATSHWQALSRRLDMPQWHAEVVHIRGSSRNASVQSHGRQDCQRDACHSRSGRIYNTF